ncbi:tetratricopeptide repeat protein [Streptomyces sp. NPDC049949]|uniref:tetratricopeptide repeat protein n=1 Tax=Streptomyces sp. NPDC049949 TaxID=3154627 RepID=UPI00343A141F
MTGSDDRHGIHNTISGGVYFSAVVQGAHANVTLQLPATVPAALTGLPAPSPAFTGREAEEESLLAGVRPDPSPAPAARQVISGLPGVGKTELAVQVAHRALGDADLLPGGVLFIDLFGYDDRRRVGPHRALGSLLRALAVPHEHVPEDLGERAGLYRSVLAAYAAGGRRILVVLDNAMDSAQVRPLLPGDPAVPVLITSRHTLSDLGARVLDLSVLGRQAAVELVGANLRSIVGPADTRVADEPAAAAELADLCGRLPLALSVVSALLADIPTRPLHSMAAALGDARRRLERLSREDLAVRAAFDLSYRHLAPDQARLFRLLALNPGPDLATETVAALAGTEPWDAEDLLLPLARGHFIEPGPPPYGRWRMHDLMRLYADELCRSQDEPGDREAATDRLYLHYLAGAHAADTHVDAGLAPDPLFPDRDEALVWLDAERHNLRAAALAAPGLARPEALVQLHSSLLEFHSLRRHFDEYAELAVAALGAVRASQDPVLRATESSILNNLGTARRELRLFDDASASYQEALALHERDGDPFAAAATLTNLGLTYQQMNRPEEAVDLLRQALDRYPPDSDPRARGMAYNNLGKALHDLRRLPEASEAFAEDIAICRAAGDRRGEGTALNNLGMVLRDMGQYGAAAEAHEDALAAAEETGDLYGAGLALANSGLALAMGRDERGPQEAVDRLMRALEILDSLGDEHMAAQARSHLGLVLIQAGRAAEALDPLESVVEASTRTGDPHTAAMALTNLGTALELTGLYEDAVRAQTRSVSLYRQLGERHHEAKALLNLGLALRHTGGLAAAQDAFHSSATAFRETGDEYLHTQALRLHEETGRWRTRQLPGWLRGSGPRTPGP